MRKKEHFYTVKCFFYHGNIMTFQMSSFLPVYYFLGPSLHLHNLEVFSRAVLTLSVLRKILDIQIVDVGHDIITAANH